MYKGTLVDVKYGGVTMYIGNVLKQRMKDLKITKDQLIEESFVDDEVVEGLLDDTLSISDVEIDDIEFIAEVLYCTPEYFTSDEKRHEDILSSCLNRGKNSLKSNYVKVRIQSIMEDFEFMNDIYEKVESGVNV